MSCTKKVLFITSEAPRKKVYGGPLAVIQNFVDKLYSKSDIYCWQPIAIFGDLEAKGNSSSNFLDIPKKMLGKITRFAFFRYTLSFIFAMRHLNRLFERIKNFSQKLERNYEKICTADVIHCHDIYAMVALLNVIDKKPRVTFKPIILLEIHSDGATSEEVFRLLHEQRLTLYGYYLKKYELYALSRSHCIIVPSNGAKRQLLLHIPKLKGLKKRIYILYNGIEKMSIIPKKEAKAMLRVGEDNTLIISVGRLTYDKGFDTLVKSIKIIVNRGFEGVRLLIAGDGPNKKYLEKLIESFKLKSWIKILGYVPHDKINILYSAADIYVSSSRKAAFDLSLLEALSAGLPIIATKVGGNLEIIDNVGMLVEPDNPEMLANTLLFLIVDKHCREKLALDASVRFHKNFNIEIVVDSYVQMLNELINIIKL